MAAEDDPDMNNTINLSTESMELDKFAGETIDGSDKFPIVDKPGTKSEIWRYFGLHADKDGKPVNNGTAVCRICNRDVLAKAGNTSNLISHLCLKHPSVYAQSSFISKPSSSKADSHQKRQISIASSFAQSQPYDRKSKKWNSLTKVVTYCIVKDGLPLYTVEKEGFKKMLYKFDPRYEPPSRNYISRIAVPDLYATTKEQVMKKLSKVAYFASTTDMWSSTAGLMPYMSYTVHFINEDWELESLSLGTHFLPEDHTAPILAEAMQSTLVEWKLQSSQQSCLTTDNGANIVAAARDLFWVRISCFGHNLYLAITKAFDQTICSRAIGIAHKIVSAFSISWKRCRELSTAQVNLNLPHHSLISDCKTRWGSTQQMIKRLLEQEQAIRVVLSADRKVSYLVPTWQDVDIWKAINAALEPLAGFTDILSGWL